MKIRSIAIVLSAMILTSVIFGCGGGGGGSTTTPVISTSTLFPDVDEIGLIANPPEQKVQTVSNSATIQTAPTKGSKVELDSSAAVGTAEDGTSILVKTSSDINTTHIGQPLFIGGIFQGMIHSVSTNGNTLVVGVEDAQKLSDVYNSFNVSFRNDAIKQAVKRALSQKQIGRYDYLNTNPLHVSVLEKPVTNKRGITSDEIVLRIDIPEGYYVPIQPHKRSCDFWNAECSVTVQGEVSKNLDLGNSYTQYGITFSTSGSYIEIGLGTYLRAHYDYNAVGSDVLDFDLAQSAYFQSNMTVSVSGELSKDWSTTINLLGNIDIEIAHPYSLVAKTSVIVSPGIVFGVDGKIKGSITANSYISRAGEIQFAFDSTDMSHNIQNSISYTPKNLNNDSVTLSIEADANAYIYPAITILPSLKFVRIAPPITLVFLRSGIKLNTNINGKISTGFTVIDDDALSQSTATEASLTTSLEGLVQGRWYVRISPIDIYNTAAYKDILSTGKMNVLEWKAVLLDAPQVEVKEKSGDFNKREVTFSIETDATVEPKIYYYYTLDGKDVPATNITTHKPVWKLGDAPIEVDKNTRIKVRAVLYNKDVSTSIWAWGTSISSQTDKLVTLINKPDVTPGSSAFEDEVWVSMSQDQGYDIYYQKDNAAAVKYSTPIKLTNDTTLVVYAKDEVNGEKVFSEEVTYKYDKCESNEALENGECVASSSSSSSSSSSHNVKTVDVIALFNAQAAYFDNLFNTYNKCPSSPESGKNYANITLNPESLHCGYTDGVMDDFSVNNIDSKNERFNYTDSLNGHSEYMTHASETFHRGASLENGNYWFFDEYLGTSWSDRKHSYSLNLINFSDSNSGYVYKQYTKEGIADYSARYDASGELTRFCQYKEDGNGYLWCEPEF